MNPAAQVHVLPAGRGGETLSSVAEAIKLEEETHDSSHLLRWFTLRCAALHNFRDKKVFVNYYSKVFEHGPLLCLSQVSYNVNCYLKLLHPATARVADLRTLSRDSFMLSV